LQAAVTKIWIALTLQEAHKPATGPLKQYSLKLAISINTDTYFICPEARTYFKRLGGHKKWPKCSGLTQQGYGPYFKNGFDQCLFVA